MSARLFIIRGVPGSGKSHLAKQLLERDPNLAHIEADMYFVGRNGVYRFEPKQIPAAHRWCFEAAGNYLAADNMSVIVSNTFTQLWELERYLKFADTYPTVVFTPLTQFQNVHGVPDDKVEAMRRRWEQIPDDRILFKMENSFTKIEIIK